jgi:hypothetical protein
MNKITNDHLSRAAYVYIRQSTAGQLINNKEGLLPIEWAIFRKIGVIWCSMEASS